MIKNQIIKELNQIVYNIRPNEIFEDFLDITLATLESLPAHAQNVSQSGKLAQDTETTQRLFEKIHNKYSQQMFEHFRSSFHLLTNIQPIQEYRNLGDFQSPDVLGDIYMEWAYPNPSMGQYFTPWNIAQLMSQITNENMEADIYERLRTAIKKSPIGRIIGIDPNSYSDDILLESAITFNGQGGLEYFEPLTVHDPCCGSGIMLLSVASQCPPWALSAGLVKFYGQDIDSSCVKMCKINCILYGLNSVLIRSVYELSKTDISTLPEQWQSQYIEAQKLPSDDPEIIRKQQKLKLELKYQQAGLFDI